MIRNYEIGSEFMTNSYIIGQNQYISLKDFPKRYVLSGRTGLYLISEELKLRGIYSVSLPAYCCGSMVAPFVDAGCTVSFYEKNQVSTSEAILIMDYFGYLKDETVEFTKKCKNMGKIVIIDATQTAFSKAKTYDYADFILVSYRKWFDCLCAAVYSKTGFFTKEYDEEAYEYVKIWREASEKKREFVSNGTGEKQSFLNLYAKANSILNSDYIGYKASILEIEKVENVNSSYIRNRRRQNALTLMEALSKDFNMMFKNMGKEDCPLHVPICINKENREELKRKLIYNEVYCPCHWPIDEKYPYIKTKYHEQELSLICDQRYSKEDMLKQIEILKKYLVEKR